VAPKPSYCIWGIDPGQTGCLAVLTPTGPSFLDFTTPTDLLPKIIALSALNPDLVVLERIQKAPRDNSRTATTFLHNSGWWRGVLDTLFPSLWILVWPQTWMAFHKLPAKTGPTDKERSLIYLHAKHPLLSDTPGLALKKHHNRADALLMALYGQHLLRDDPLKLDDMLKETQNRREA